MGLFVIRMPLVHGWATGIEPQVRIDRKIYMRDTFTFVYIAGSTCTHTYIYISREREREIEQLFIYAHSTRYMHELMGA